MSGFCQGIWKSLILSNLENLIFLVEIEYRLSPQEWNLGDLVEKTGIGFINLS